MLKLSFDARAELPVWVDPEWTTTESMAVPRARFAAFGAESPAGVMVAGGVDDQGTPLASTETFDAWTHTWSVLEPLRGARVDPIVFGDFGAFVYVLGGASVVERRAWDGGSWEAAGLTQNLVGCLASGRRLRAFKYSSAPPVRPTRPCESSIRPKMVFG
ncbi:MAG: hypothetical protein R3B07_18900 [Polyangiaceae bacterium]